MSKILHQLLSVDVILSMMIFRYLITAQISGNVMKVQPRFQTLLYSLTIFQCTSFNEAEGCSTEYIVVRYSVETICQWYGKINFPGSGRFFLLKKIFQDNCAKILSDFDDFCTAEFVNS